MVQGRRRIAVSVSPRLLSDTLARLLDAAGVDDVVFVSPGDAVEGRFDGAILSQRTAVDADVVIELPAGSGPGTVHTREADLVIDLTDVMTLAEVLDQHVGGTESRSEWFRSRDCAPAPSGDEGNPGGLQ